MATVKFSAIVTDVRGKIGGVIFARGKNGSYAKSLTKPINANTSVQQIKRNNLSYYAAKWRSLDDADRQAWIDQAPSQKYRNRVGEVAQYSGYQLFMKTNLILESAALNE